jgi:hypothetical protein
MGIRFRTSTLRADRARRTPISRPIQGRGHYQELLLFAGRIATSLRLTGPTRGSIVSVKMESILFQGIFAWVICRYQ